MNDPDTNAQYAGFVTFDADSPAYPGILVTDQATEETTEHVIELDSTPDWFDWSRLAIAIATLIVLIVIAVRLP